MKQVSKHFKPDWWGKREVNPNRLLDFKETAEAKATATKYDKGSKRPIPGPGPEALVGRFRTFYYAMEGRMIDKEQKKCDDLIDSENAFKTHLLGKEWYIIMEAGYHEFRGR